MRRGAVGGLVTLAGLLAATPCLGSDSWHAMEAPAAPFAAAGLALDGADVQIVLRLIRVLHSLPPGRPSNADAQVASLLDDLDVPHDASRRIEVPLPLPPDVWSATIFNRPLARHELFHAIVGDRSAALLYYGLAGLTPETRHLLASHPDVLRFVYRERAAALAAFGGSLRVAGGRVDVPGGDEARPLWEALAGAPVSDPATFLRQILARDDGRLTYFYESIDLLEGARQRFALGLALDDAADRVDRFRALYRAFTGVHADWALTSLPFVRPMYDAASLLQTARVTAAGTLAPPAQRRLWELAFASSDLPDDAARAARDVSRDDRLDAAALAELIALAPAQDRRGRFEAFAFGQRVFGDAPGGDIGAVFLALRGFARYPALLLAIERLGVSSPPAYAAIVRHALAIERINDPARQIPVHAQFQGVLAILDRLARTGRLPHAAAERLLVSLVAVAPEGSRGYRGRVAAWIETELLPALGTAGPAERRVVAALADVEPERARRIEWEGLAYSVSIQASDVRRIEAVRAKQAGNSLDGVLALHRDAAALADPALSLERVKSIAGSLARHRTDLAGPKPWPGLRGGEIPSLARALDDATRSLARIRRAKDTGRTARAVDRLVALGDYLLGEVLVALVYAPLLGDPDDLLGGDADIAHGHDFGAATALTGEARTRAPWLRPRPGNGATVVGSMLGLDLVLAPNGLRRLASDRVPPRPRLTQNDREVFASSVVLMNPRLLLDATLRDAAAAIRNGRARVLHASSDSAALDALAAAARVSPHRRQLLTWVAPDPAAVLGLFSLAELLAIGSPPDARALDAIGMSAEPLDGCYCSRFPSPGPWEAFSGRAGTGQLATRVPDLTLRVIEILDELRLPAALLPAVLSLATQDFIDDVPTLYPDDWPAAVRHARALLQTRVEDYIAALAGIGPLQPVASTQP